MIDERRSWTLGRLQFAAAKIEERPRHIVYALSFKVVGFGGLDLGKDVDELRFSGHMFLPGGRGIRGSAGVGIGLFEWSR